MKFEDIERQTFEEFGEITVFESSPQDLRLVANDVTEVRPSRAEPIAEAPVKAGFSWTGLFGGLAALAWAGAAIGGPLSYYGIEAVLTMDPAVQAGLIALALGPAVLFWLAAAAAAEAVKARRFAAELTRLAYAARASSDAGQSHVQKVSVAAKSELEALTDAVGAALARLSDLEDSAQRNAHLFGNAIAATRENALYMADCLSRERSALVDLNGEMRGQVDTMAQSVGRQIRLLREASKLVNSEIAAAEQALERRFAAFGETAAMMANRTASFHDAADAATSAAGTLNATMGQMLDGLGEATRLTDAARQSSAQAVHAANETANAVRETTRNAVFEAKRAAQLIRSETEALQESAAATLAQLRDAATAARAASEESQAVADRHASAIEKRLSALAATAGASRTPPQQRSEAPAEARTSANPFSYEAPRAPKADGKRQDTKGMRGWGKPRAQQRDAESVEPIKAPSKPAAPIEAFDLIDFGACPDPDDALKNETLDMVAAAGVDLDAVLPAGDLERIAMQSRQGPTARRRAVADLASGAVGRLSRHIQRDIDARATALEFRARPDLATAGRGENKDLVRAYLLIDAALV